MLADDEDDSTPAVGAPQGQTSQQPAWMRQLHDRCREWIGQLPAVRGRHSAAPVQWDLTEYYRASRLFPNRVQIILTHFIGCSSEKVSLGGNFFLKSAEIFPTLSRSARVL